MGREEDWRLGIRIEEKEKSTCRPEHSPDWHHRSSGGRVALQSCPFAVCLVSLHWLLIQPQAFGHLSGSPLNILAHIRNSVHFCLLKEASSGPWRSAPGWTSNCLGPTVFLGSPFIIHPGLQGISCIKVLCWILFSWIPCLPFSLFSCFSGAYLPPESNGMEIFEISCTYKRWLFCPYRFLVWKNVDLQLGNTCSQL